MILTSGSFNVGHKPLLRWIAIACASFLTGLMVLRLPLWSRSDASYLSKLSACNSLNSFFSNKPCTSTPVYRYELPQDLVLPQTGQGIAAESWIGKVTMVFNARDPTYIRALQTHEAHDRRFGYPLLILRHSILDDVWSKPAYILAALLEEMRKPERDRLKWLLCACYECKRLLCGDADHSQLG